MKMKIQQQSQEASEESSIQPLSNIKKMEAVFFVSFSALFFYMLAKTSLRIIQENYHGVLLTNPLLIFLYGFLAFLPLFVTINAINGWFDSQGEAIAAGVLSSLVISVFVFMIIMAGASMNSRKEVIEESAGYSNVEHIEDNVYYGEKDGKEFHIIIDQKDEKLFITSVAEINEESPLIELTRE